MFTEKLSPEAILLHRLIYRDDTALLTSLMTVSRHDKGFEWLGSGPFSEREESGRASRRAGHLSIRFIRGDDRLFLNVARETGDEARRSQQSITEIARQLGPEYGRKIVDYYAFLDVLCMDVTEGLATAGLKPYIKGPATVCLSHTGETVISVDVNEQGMELAAAADEAIRKDAVLAMPASLRQRITNPGQFIHEICHAAGFQRYQIKSNAGVSDAFREVILIGEDDYISGPKFKAAKDFFEKEVPPQYGTIHFDVFRTPDGIAMRIDYIGAGKDYADDYRGIRSVIRNIEKD